ncbi:MAG TPA: hypothetical protein DCL45_01195 [Chloroflexi bacterium]|nr:hypothetical protein [Chloroflexota bacterium]
MTAVRATDQTVSVLGTLDPFGDGSEDTSGGRVAHSSSGSVHLLAPGWSMGIALWKPLGPNLERFPIGCRDYASDGMKFVEWDRNSWERPW